MFRTCISIIILLALAACGGGSQDPTPPAPVITPPPTLSLTIDANEKPAAESATLTWSAGNATTCTASGDWSGTRTTSGSETTEPLFARHSFTLSCTGPGGNVTASVDTARTVVVSSKLLDEVVTLSAATMLTLVYQDESTLIFDGAVLIDAGAVFLTDENAYKALGVEMQNGQTIITVGEPNFEEIFEHLRIAGSFEADSSDWILGATSTAFVENTKTKFSDVELDAKTSLASFSHSVSVSNPPFSLSATHTVSASMTIDFDYSILRGLKKGGMSVELSSRISNGSLELTPGSLSYTTPMLAGWPFPVPGLPGVNVFVPIYGQFSVGASATLATDLGFSASAKLGISWNDDADVSSNFDFRLPGVSASITSAGSDPLNNAWQSYPVEGGVFIVAKPALRFLKRQFVGISSGIGISMEGTVERVPDREPGYCAQLLSSNLRGQASGFLKAPGKTIETAEISTVLRRLSGPFPPFGICLWPSHIQLQILEEIVPTIGQSLEIRAVASGLDPSISGGNIPAGVVEIDLDGNKCVATLDAAGIGSCVVVPKFGGPRKVIANYAGDTQFSAFYVERPLDVMYGKWEARDVALSGSLTAIVPLPSPPGGFASCTLAANANMNWNFSLDGESPSAAYGNVVTFNNQAGCPQFSPLSGGTNISLTVTDDQVSGSNSTTLPNGGGTISVNLAGTISDTGFSGDIDWTLRGGKLIYLPTGEPVPGSDVSADLSGSFSAVAASSPP